PRPPRPRRRRPAAAHRTHARDGPSLQPPFQGSLPRARGTRRPRPPARWHRRQREDEQVPRQHHRSQGRRRHRREEDQDDVRGPSARGNRARARCRKSRLPLPRCLRPRHRGSGHPEGAIRARGPAQQSAEGPADGGAQQPSRPVPRAPSPLRSAHADGQRGPRARLETGSRHRHRNHGDGPRRAGPQLPGAVLMLQPTLEQVKEIARQGGGNILPIYREVPADLETPVSAFLKVKRGQYSFLLESVEGGERLARYSFLGTEPYRVIRTGEGQAGGEGDPLLQIEDELRRFSPVHQPGLPRFTGGAVGFLSYEVARYYEKLPMPAADPQGFPESVF